MNSKDIAGQLALKFLNNVWGPTHNLDIIDKLMSTDYSITTGGQVIAGRENFKSWVQNFQLKLTNAITTNQEIIVSESGDRVVSRWVCTGNNNGIFGLPADGQAVKFTGIAIWKVAEGKLTACWVERSALELYQELKD